jgi:predicted  nucleic acid-binding Zn-ribbon protein
VPQRFLDPRAVFSARLDGAFEDAAEPPRPDGRIVYKPALWADLALRFDEARYGYDETYELHKVWFPLGEQLPDEARTAAFEGGDLLSNPPAGARFTTLPDWMDEARELKALQKRVVDDLYRSESRGLFINRTLKLYARGDEDRAAFDARCAEAVEELVDAEVAKLQARYETKIDRLDERIRKKEAKIVELEGVLKARKVEEAVNIGETLLSFFGGRKKSLGSAVTKRRMTSSTGTRITQAKDDIAALQEQGVELQDELEDAIAAIRDRHEGALEDTEEYAVGLEKADIGVRGFGVLWIPVTRRI